MKLKISKNLILSCLLALFAISAQAQQPVFTQNNIPTIGTKYTLYPCDTALVSAGDAGENITWDFTKIGAFLRPLNVNFVDPQTTPRGNLFEESDLAKVADTTTTYYQTSNEFVRVMGYSGNLNNVLQLIADPYDALIPIPIKYAQENTDQFNGSFKIANEDGVRSGESRTVYDAYGTLQFATLSVKEVMRITQQVRYTDTWQSKGKNLIGEHTVLTHTWYVEDNPAPVFEIETDDFTISADGNEIQKGTTKKVWINRQYISGVTSTAQEELNTVSSIYPNPARDYVSCLFAGVENAALQIQISDALGTAVQVPITITNADSGLRLQLQTNTLASGVYRVTIVTSSGTQSLPFTVIK